MRTCRWRIPLALKRLAALRTTIADRATCPTESRCLAACFACRESSASAAVDTFARVVRHDTPLGMAHHLAICEDGMWRGTHLQNMWSQVLLAWSTPTLGRVRAGQVSGDVLQQKLLQ